MSFLKNDHHNLRIGRSDRQWLADQIKGAKDLSPHRARLFSKNSKISYSKIITEPSKLNALAEKGDFDHLGFFAKDNVLAGYVIPAARLCSFFNRYADVKDRTDIQLVGLRPSYNIFRDSAYQPPGDDALTAHVLLTGGRGHSTCLLPVISPKLYQILSGPTYHEAESAPRPSHDRNSAMLSLPKSLNIFQGRKIGERCSQGHAVNISRISTRMVAVPPGIGEALKRQHFGDRADDFIQEISAADFNHQTFSHEALSKEDHFFTVSRGGGWQSKQFKEDLFTLIPFHLLPLLNRTADGVIQSVKETADLRFAFDVSARAYLKDNRFEVDVVRADQEADVREQLSVLKIFARDQSIDASKGGAHGKGFSSGTVRLSGLYGVHGGVEGLSAHFDAGSWPAMAQSLTREHVLNIGSMRLALC